MASKLSHNLSPMCPRLSTYQGAVRLLQCRGKVRMHAFDSDAVFMVVTML